MSEKSLRKLAFELYKPPFKHQCGYIFDNDNNMVADDNGDARPDESGVLRIRGWGRIGAMENPEELQDMVGDLVAEALTKFWEQTP